MPYRVELKSSAKSDLRKLEHPVRVRIQRRIDELAHNPRPHGVLKLKGRDAVEYRIRVGNYRIVYEVYDQVLLVWVVGIDDRKNIYR